MVDDYIVLFVISSVRALNHQSGGMRWMDTVDFYDASGSGPVSFFFRSVFGRALQGGEASRFLGWRSSPEFSDRALGPTVWGWRWKIWWWNPAKNPSCQWNIVHGNMSTFRDVLKQSGDIYMYNIYIYIMIIYIYDIYIWYIYMMYIYTYDI